MIAPEHAQKLKLREAGGSVVLLAGALFAGWTREFTNPTNEGLGRPARRRRKPLPK